MRIEYGLRKDLFFDGLLVILFTLLIRLIGRRGDTTGHKALDGR